MKKLILMITVVTLLSGCGVFNKVFKQKVKEKTLEVTSKTDRSKTQTSIIDNSVTTITERLDSTIKTPEVKGEGKKKLDLNALADGLTIIDDEFVNLYQIYNPKDSSLKTGYTLKPQKVPVPKERKTVKENDIKTLQSDEKDVKEKGKKESKKVDAIVDRKADYKVIFIIIAVICLFIFVGWLIKGKKFSTK